LLSVFLVGFKFVSERLMQTQKDKSNKWRPAIVCLSGWICWRRKLCYYLGFLFDNYQKKTIWIRTDIPPNTIKLIKSIGMQITPKILT